MNNKVIEDFLSESNEEKVLDRYNVTFMYLLKDAIGIPLSVVYVTGDENNNLCFIKDGEVLSTINTNGLNEVLLKYKDSFNENKNDLVPPVGVMDGYINEVYFKVNNTWYSDHIYNLAFYENKVVEENKHLNVFVSILDEALNALYKENKDVVKYFVTTDE